MNSYESERGAQLDVCELGVRCSLKNKLEASLMKLAGAGLGRTAAVEYVAKFWRE